MNKNNWTYKKLGEVATLVADGDWIESKDQSEQGIRLIQTGNISNGFFKSKDDKPHFISEETMSRLNCTEIFQGDCLVSRLPDPVGRACLIPNIGCRMITAVDCSIIRFSNDYLPQFFVDYSQSAKYRNSVNNNTTGTTRKRISRKNLEKIPIPIPPLAEQERIVAELDLLSSIIDKKKAQLKELDQLAQSIFYDMFGDPITNEKGWEVKKLGEVCEYSKTRIKSEELTAENYVGVENLLQDCKGKVVANKVPDGMGLTEYIKGDVLLGNIRPYLKKIWLANNRGGCNGDVLAIRIQSDHSNHILPIYIFGCLSKDAFFDYDMQYSKGEKMPRGDKKEIVKYPICIPPLPLQQEFADKVEAIERQKSLIQQSIDEVQTLFDSRMDYWFG